KAISDAQVLDLIGLRMPIQAKAEFATLSPRETASIAVAVVRKGNREDHARAAFLLFHAGEPERAEEHLQEAGETGREVEKVFGR
ncbi:MAG: hypothetical protein ACYSU0_11320, partial [Planctomycetota bacterium]